MEKNDFIKTIAKYVRKYANTYGIVVHSPIIAQAILESGWGESKLAAVYHNYFGLKCGTKWTGKSVNMKTMEEYEPGKITQITDNFRAYGSMEEGVKGYFDFIQLQRYKNLKGITDPVSYIKTIKADGYSTSSKYVENTVRIVEQYNLTQYDKKEGTKIPKSVSTALNQARAWIGCSEATGTHKEIIDIYNTHKPLARGYIVKYDDSWCATFISAVAIKCGLTDIIPTECGCGQMVKLFRELGEWDENDSRIPYPGDIVFYDWGDSGNGDNTGWPNHVGIVESVNSGQITIIEGNNLDSVKRRTIAINGKYIRGYGVPKYDTTAKSIPEVAKEVIAGVWGNGTDRKARLEAAGYDYVEVQREVNDLYNGTDTKSVETVAKEVIAGVWGNGTNRKVRLEAAGYDYVEVQREVNTILQKVITNAALRPENKENNMSRKPRQ